MTVTRWSFLERREEDAEFPELPLRAYLAEWLMDIGRVMQGGMGPVALSHSEIRAWAANVGLKFEGDEAMWLQKMSAAYAGEISESNGNDTPQPFRE